MATIRAPKPTSVDFEGFGIKSRPDYPPVPVGVSIKKWGKKPRYYAWGHPTGNNCTKEQAIAALEEAYACPDGVLFHNARFDLDVAETHLGLPIPSWDRIHDTLFLLFLDNPHSFNLGLKPNAKAYLGMEPEERDAVADWLIEHQPLKSQGIKITRSKQKGSKHPVGAYIAYAPGDLVGSYANGDVIRTEGLFELLWKKTVIDRQMGDAYDRERKLIPIFLDMERQGLRVDVERLERDVNIYQNWHKRITDWIIKKLQCDPNTNLDSEDQLYDVLTERHLLDISKMGRTKKGAVSLSGASLQAGLLDPLLSSVLRYRSQLGTCLGTFMGPWLETAKRSGGLIFTNWNQVRSPDGGTRTGRLSSSDTNLQNIPKEFARLFDGIDDRGQPLPKCPWKDLPPLPLCRGYIIPYAPGEVLVDRDYCFSPDTEVLTETGFVRFDQLSRGVRLAQWNGGAIDFAYPTHYQVAPFKGDLVNIIGDRSCDLLVTPSHKCLVLNERMETYFCRADAYPIGHHKQIAAGIKLSGEKLNPAVIKLAVAAQADATVKAGGDRLVWKMKKPRKREQLRAIFEELGLAYQEVPLGDQVTITTRASFVPGLTDLLDLTTKTFIADRFRGLDQAGRATFLLQLGLWDGRQNGTKDAAWSYFSTNVANVELACELAPFTGLRANLSTQTLRSGKLFATVNLRLNPATWTDTYRIERVLYDGLTYCVTMPHSTLIVRRNGKISITGQSQQEPRILGHFENGPLMDQYAENPWIDYHDNAKDQLERVFKRPFKRKPVKNINLGIIYGQGIASLALKNNESFDETKALQKAILALYPGLGSLRDEMKFRARAGQPIRTWGGREYYCEPPRIIDGRLKTFDYKMVNVLVQGSAADCIKEAVIRFYAVKKPHWRLLLQVHDELLLSVPEGEMVQALEVLRETMESVEFDVKILSEGTWSPDNWAALVDYDKKGRLVVDPTTLPPQRERVKCAPSKARPDPLKAPASSRPRPGPSKRGAGAATKPTSNVRSSSRR